MGRKDEDGKEDKWGVKSEKILKIRRMTTRVSKKGRDR
jgi:hypothetical protein